MRRAPSRTAQNRGDRELLPRFGGYPWERNGASAAQSVVGLLILATISITLVIALRTAEEGRIWLLLVSRT